LTTVYFDVAALSVKFLSLSTSSDFLANTATACPTGKVTFSCPIILARYPF
jgi:hypothetical protein